VQPHSYLQYYLRVDPWVHLRLSPRVYLWATLQVYLGFNLRVNPQIYLQADPLTYLRADLQISLQVDLMSYMQVTLQSELRVCPQVYPRVHHGICRGEYPDIHPHYDPNELTSITTRATPAPSLMAPIPLATRNRSCARGL